MEQKQLPLFGVEPSLKPKIGEVRTGGELGYKYSKNSYIWVSCPECNKQRWLRKDQVGRRKNPGLCYECSHTRYGNDNPRWKGGRIKVKGGYIMVKLFPKDFFYPMCNAKGYVMEHRLVVAKRLGRCLQPWEKVHHKNGIKDDNRFSKLKLTTAGSHSIEHSKGYRDGYHQGYQDGQSEALKELKQQIKLLQWQIKELKGDNRFVWRRQVD